MKKNIFSFIFLLLLLSSSPIASAQQGDFRLVTSPLPINLVTEPGKSVSVPIRVKNDGASQEKLQISLQKFSAYGENGAPKIMDPEPGDDFLNWVSFSEKEFTAAPGEWKTITATFNVPETAAFGYYYAIVFSRDQEDIDVQPGQTTLSGGSAVLVLLEARVADAKRQVEVVEFSADKKWYEFLPATFTVRLKNTGNVHIAPHGNIFIGRKGNKDSSLLDVNLEGGNILPDSFREFEVKWEDGFPVYKDKKEDGTVLHDEQGNTIKQLVWDWKDVSKLRWGVYEADLFLVYNDGSRDVPIEGTVTFSVWPWRMMLGGAFISLFALVGIKSTLSNLWKKLFGKKKTVE